MTSGGIISPDLKLEGPVGFSDPGEADIEQQKAIQSTLKTNPLKKLMYMLIIFNILENEIQIYAYKIIYKMSIF
jgi:hypothetical protein